MTEKNDNQRTYRRFGISERLKCFFSMCCFFLFCSLLFAQANNSVVVWVMPTEGKNLGNTELRWLPDEIHRVLREKITNYSGLTVAEENSDSLASIQERSYNENVSEAVRMGRQLGANYVICSTVTKTNNSYSLNVIFQNLETGTHFAESNQYAISTENLYVVPGCAVNNAVIELCDKLDSKFGTGLSSYTKRILQKGENDLTGEEEGKYLEEEEKRLRSVISNLDKEIASNRLSSASDAAVKAVQLELRKSQEQEKLKQAQQKQERLMQEAQNRLAELDALETRTDAQKKRISAAESNIKEKIEQLRKQSFDTSGVLPQIYEIEAKKKAVLDIQKENDVEIRKLQQDQAKELSAKHIEIMNAPLRETQKNSSTGEMLPEVRADRESKYAVEEKRINTEYGNNIESVNSIALAAEKELMEQINNQYDLLCRYRIADNIETKELKLTVGRFRGEAKAWSASVTLISDGKALCSYSFDLGYEMLTKKKADPTSDEYADNVDFYSSLFSNEKTPPVWVKLRYMVSPAAVDNPSTYEIFLSSLTIIKTENEEELNTITINKTETRKMSPSYDIRSVMRDLGMSIDTNNNQTSSSRTDVPAADSKQQQYSDPYSNNTSSYYTQTQTKNSLFDDSNQLSPNGLFGNLVWAQGPFYDGIGCDLSFLWGGKHLYWGAGISFLELKTVKGRSSGSSNGKFPTFWDVYLTAGLSCSISSFNAYAQGTIGLYLWNGPRGFILSGKIGIDLLLFGGFPVGIYYELKNRVGSGFEDVIGIRALGYYY